MLPASEHIADAAAFATVAGRMSKRPKSDNGTAPHYGFHDLVSWQKDDTSEKEKKTDNERSNQRTS